MVIKKFTNKLGSKMSGSNPFRGFGGGSTGAARPDDESFNSLEDDSPESNAGRGVRLFCESGGPNTAGEEVLHLPVIVDAAESSPQAATVAAKTIRKFLSKENYSRPHVQYNAVMLIRILADNPGASFTRNLDAKFTAVVKELLRTGRDPSVQQILRETLAALYVDKAYDTNLNTLFQMWNKESGTAVPTTQSGFQNDSGPQAPVPMAFQQPRENYQRRGRNETGLPEPQELAARIEEARTSAKLLQQLVQSTPPAELQSNELIKEFADRCQTAQRSVQSYLNCDNPSPDDATMQTLIETSEQLSLAASKHQRAVLQARRTLETVSTPPQNVYTPPDGPPPRSVGAVAVPAGENDRHSSDAASLLSDYANSDTQQSYHPPDGPPPSMQRPYSSAPLPPPSMRANLERRITDPKAVPGTLPVRAAPQAPTFRPPEIPGPSIGAVGLPAQSHEDPFSDNQGNSEDDEYDDDPYHQPKSPNPAASSTLATVGTRPAPRDQESWRDPIPEESDTTSSRSDPYNLRSAGDQPGFISSPISVNRRESGEENSERYGAVSPDRTRLNRSGAVSPTYEPNSGEISPVFENLDERYAGGRGGSAAPGYRY